MQEFVKSGFDKASTNEIVKEAGISKGSLFNYFNNKKELYLFLIGYGNKVIEQIYKEIDMSQTDLFKRIGQIGLIKFRIQKKSPKVFDFLTSINNEESVEVKTEIIKNKELALKKGYGKIYENIDFSKFQKDIDIKKAMNILNWTMLGFAEEAQKKIKSYDEIDMEMLKQWESYSDILKRSFYKEGDEE
ncbi:transcriptional regulator [Halalkalibacter hemicellulosilyticusJCM 9152]|uniref:Transcriptional regulator n=2 Tax=Halalkalibacter TaxID=2893056 RepID=W4QIB9_9BACI|nr:transcriptional regulator [Halalkalibacter hemicellulosilyticusJCM 9152]